MRDRRSTTSIARRVAWSFQRRRLWRILFQTVVLAAAGLAIWCLAVEWTTAGTLVPGNDRYLSIEAWAWPTGMSAGEILLWLRQGEGVLDGVVVYHYGDKAVPIGGFVFWLAAALLALLALRLLLWAVSSLRAAGRVRRFLKPIDDIAQVTESISSSGFDESKFHSLEDAIDHINGVSPDEKLQIGDDDLAGLETAVNNLIVRMHNGYRQQVRFVDDASHELRTPIAVIQGYVNMLDRWGKTDEQVLEESIRAIQTETEHMKTLVEQLLFLARGDAGRQTLNMEALDLAALTREVWEESRMIDPAHEYVFQGGETVPARGDEAMLKQAVRILVENARKYSPEGSRITLRAYTREGQSCAEVQDNGSGIAPEDVPRIFDRFYRTDEARSSETGGSGLGLSIARWIVGRHGGRFRVTSYEGVGTRVAIDLPPDGKRAEPPKAAPPRPQVTVRKPGRYTEPDKS